MGAQPTGLIDGCRCRDRSGAKNQGIGRSVRQADEGLASPPRAFTKDKKSDGPEVLHVIVGRVGITLVFSSLNPAFPAVRRCRRRCDLPRSGPAPLSRSISPPGRRDRAFVRDHRRALGQHGTPRDRRDQGRRRARCRAGIRLHVPARALCDAEVRRDFGGSAGTTRHATPSPRRSRLDQPSLRPRGWWRSGNS